MLRCAPFVLALALLACGPAEERLDGSVADGGSESRAAAPLRASPVWQAACPDGWMEQLQGGARACVPWDSPPSCAAGEERFPGDSACAPLGGGCPAGAFAEGLAGDVRHVALGGGSTAAGTASDPFDTIASALAGASSGTTIAIGRGTFEETFIDVPAGVRLVGVCAAETRITTSHVERGRALIAALAGSVELSGLTLSGSLFGLIAAGGSVVSLDSVVIDATTGIGALAVGGARIEGHDVVIQDVRGGTDGNATGIGANGGTVALSRLRVTGVVTTSVFSAGDASRVELTDAHLSDALTGPRGVGIGVEVDGGAVSLTRTIVRGGEQVGIKVGFEGTTLELRDVVIEDVGSRGGGGAGIIVGVGASLDAERVLIQRVTGSGVQVQESLATLTDVVVIECVAPFSSGGLLALRGSELTVVRAHVVGGSGAGLALGRASSAMVTDLWVEGTVPGPDMPYALGVLVVNGSTLTLERASLTNNGGGVLVATNANATMLDVIIEDNAALDDEILVGLGIVVADASVVNLTRARVQRALANGIVVEGAGARLEAEDLVVTDTRERRCEMSCGANTHGSSVVASDGGYVSLTRFEIRGSALAGLRLLTGGQMDLAAGEVREHPIGIDIQTAGFDPNRISTGVLYLDNQRNVAQSEMPPPEISIPTL